MQRDFHIRIFTYPGSNFDTKWTGRKILTGFIEAKASGHHHAGALGQAMPVALLPLWLGLVTLSMLQHLSKARGLGSFWKKGNKVLDGKLTWGSWWHRIQSLQCFEILVVTLTHKVHTWSCFI